MDKPIPEELAQRLKYNFKTGNNKLLPELRKCDDCSQMVENRTVEMRWRTPPYRPGHWARRCDKCNLYANPETGVFEFDLKQINAFFKR